ncbi:hypothetical protein COV18_06325 [Candidatus Woesearchaeota archaeon CG10_big_fil_rev_8_21_14_0_10_37_12]|nr:MAG: hypothetical protein COV18_06325 [Candidatus Woesearchaeota archaeon CG10_big_fil_rev_8_21_14_0_10_37_12]
MNWTKGVILTTIILTLILTASAIKSETITIQEINQPTNTFVNSPRIIPVNTQLTKLAVSGYWNGLGNVQIWMHTQEKNYLAFDTNNLPSVGYGIPFYNHCIETCELPISNVNMLTIHPSGPATLHINTYHVTKPTNPTGLAVCPGCKNQQTNSPDHTLFLAALLLAITIIGAHVLHHKSPNIGTKKAFAILFISSFVVLGILFSFNMAAPTGAATTLVKQSASILSALSLIVLFVVAAIEIKQHNALNSIQEKLVTSQKSTLPVQQTTHVNIWNDLEEVEKKWRKRK